MLLTACKIHEHQFINKKKNPRQHFKKSLRNRIVEFLNFIYLLEYPGIKFQLLNLSIRKK
jgi:hypothetical protein